MFARADLQLTYLVSIGFKIKGLLFLLNKTATKIGFTRTNIFTLMSLTELDIKCSLY